MSSLLSDPWVAAQIDAAVAPYRKLWPPEAVEAFREEMARTLETHPTMSRLLRETRPEVVESSGEVRVAGGDVAPSPAENARRTGTR